MEESTYPERVIRLVYKGRFLMPLAELASGKELGGGREGLGSSKIFRKHFREDIQSVALRTFDSGRIRYRRKTEFATINCGSIALKIAEA